jgi:hypothetical protein
MMLIELTSGYQKTTFWSQVPKKWHSAEDLFAQVADEKSMLGPTATLTTSMKQG